MKITNTTSRDLGLTPSLVVPAKGSIDVAEIDLIAVENSKPVRAWIEDGSLVADDELPTKPTGPDLNDRQAIVAGIMRGLDEDDFTDGGKPRVEAINAVLPERAEPVAAQERDMVWDMISDSQ